ncbi:MAG TPA: tRNA pseudouridine(55) synthase TruB [Xanthobacteraceae bacterium]|nr:tRNA pseudouridine(55) synthase TruB [Xanthobacteraceae bacterium]
MNETAQTAPRPRQQFRRDKRDVHGWVLLDKPVDMTSTQAVGIIKRLFAAKRAGHAGTLDPLASGMLPIALGEATKTVPFVMEGAKVYRFTVTWGSERSTDDLEGEVTARADLRPAPEAIRALLPRYTGIILQVPPRFSAIRIGGERAYDLAREGETPDLPSREVEIARLDLVDCPAADQAVFEIECGKGTYVRALARDLGRDLGCFGHVSALRRTEVAPFAPEDLVTLAEIEAAREDDGTSGDGALRSFARRDALLVDTLAALDSLPRVKVGDDAAQRIRLGNPVVLRGRDAPLNAAEACVTAHGRLVAIGSVESGMFKPKRVFSL